MAKKGISIPIASDTRDFAQGVKDGVIKPLEGVEDALDDIAREGDQAGDKLEKALEGAQRETEQLERDHKDLGRVIRDEAAKSSREIRRSSGDGFRDAKSNAAEFKQEALQNFSEVTSSFDGSMTAVTDLAQGTLGGLAAGIAGPLGLAFGGAAVGVGLIGSAIESVGETTEADKARAGEWAQAYIEAGSKILTAAQMTAKGMEIATDPDRLKEAEENAKNWGVTTATAIAAMTGNQWALDAATASVEKLTAAQDVQFETAKNSTNPNQVFAQALAQASSDATQGASSLKKLKDEMSQGARQADVYSQYLSEMAANTAGATKTVDEFGDSIYALPDGTTIYIDAETGQATQDTDAIANKIYGLQDKTVSISVDTTTAKSQLEDLFKNPFAVKTKVLLPNSPTYGVAVP